MTECDSTRNQEPFHYGILNQALKFSVLLRARQKTLQAFPRPGGQDADARRIQLSTVPGVPSVALIWSLPFALGSNQEVRTSVPPHLPSREIEVINGPCFTFLKICGRPWSGAHCWLSHLPQVSGATWGIFPW